MSYTPGWRAVLTLTELTLTDLAVKHGCDQIGLPLGKPARNADHAFRARGTRAGFDT